MFTVSIFENESCARSYDFNSKDEAWSFYYERGRRIRNGVLFLIDNIRHELIDKWEKNYFNEPSFAF